MVLFPGIYVAVITPFTATGTVDDKRLREHIEWLIDKGVHGLVATGSCGEYAALSDQERAHVVETIIHAAAGRVPTVVGIAAPATQKAVEWTRHARDAGAQGAMALPPINYQPTRREVIAHYAALAQVGLPIIAYNNPFDTAVDLTPDLLAELAHIESFVAVKEYSGDVRRIPEILEKTSLEVLAGADDLALESLLAGATGWIAGFTNVVAEESVALYDFAREGQLGDAWSLYRRLLPLFRYDSTPRFVQAIKYALELRGQAVGTTRPPRLPLEEAEQQAVRAALAHLDSY